MTRSCILLLVFGAAMFGDAALAHHSFATTYFSDRTITIHGQVMEYMFRNPHTILQVMGSSDNGETYRWACEWAGTLTLGRLGISRGTLRPGDKVVVTGLLARNPEDHRLSVRTIERPADGWKWSGDSK
jgi:Family of unknown function (DUF6152)